MCSAKDGNELLRAIKKGTSRRKLTRDIKAITKDLYWKLLDWNSS